MKKFLLSSPIVIFISASCVLLGCYTSAQDELRKADEYMRASQFDEAIRAYESHIQKRLTAANRPDWENPYFYELLIGDVYLTQGNIPEALHHYEEAEKKGVTPALISDRYRTVARWYEERHQLQNAFDVLVKYRERDSLLFDSMLDRIGRAITEEENP